MQVTLTTVGRRSGGARPVTLFGWPDGDDIVVVGSRGGTSIDPAWAWNLRAHPRAELRIGTKERTVVASEVDGTERERLWTMVCEAFPLYVKYQGRTDRVIPLFVLEPADTSAGS